MPAKVLISSSHPSTCFVRSAQQVWNSFHKPLLVIFRTCQNRIHPICQWTTLHWHQGFLWPFWKSSLSWAPKKELKSQLYVNRSFIHLMLTLCSLKSRELGKLQKLWAKSKAKLCIPVGEFLKQCLGIMIFCWSGMLAGKTHSIRSPKVASSFTNWSILSWVPQQKKLPFRKLPTTKESVVSLSVFFRNFVASFDPWYNQNRYFLSDFVEQFHQIRCVHPRSGTGWKDSIVV